MHIQALDSATCQHCGDPSGGDVDRNDTCQSSPVNGSILAHPGVMPGSASDHQILIEFHKTIMDYEKIRV